jgi:phage-related baseplate assembly protein
MAVSLADIIKVPSKDEILNKFTSLLSLAGFPVASWQTGSFMRHTVETESDLLPDIVSLIQALGKGGFIKLAATLDGDAADAWVDLCAENVFGDARKPAIFTQGIYRLTDGGGIGPVTINPGTFWVANADKTLRFVNIDALPKTLPLNGSVDLTVQAETAGTDWNVGVGELVEILTPQPGFTGSNVAQTNGTWITQQGANAEANSALVARCLDKWATLGSGANDGAYRYYALSASSEITRVKVYSPGAGSVRVIVGGDAGPVSSTALAAAAATIEAKRPLGVPDVVTSNVSVVSQVLAGTLYVADGYDPVAALAAAQASVNALQRATPFGAKVSREQIIKALLVDAITDLDLATPAADFQLALNEMWLPSFSLVTG